jgi:hypothetical protein
MDGWKRLNNEANFYVFSTELSCGHRGEGVFIMDYLEFNEHHTNFGKNKAVVCPLCNLKVRVTLLKSKRISEWDVEEHQIGVAIRKSLRDFYEKRI